MVRRFVKLPLCYLVWVYLIWSCVGLALAEVTVTADRNPVIVGEPFTLTFSSDGIISASPDFSPLKKDFRIMGTGQSTHMQFINGQMSQSSSWQVTLFARNTGEFEIPAIRIGNDSSPVLKIRSEETPTTSSANGKAQEIIVELDLDTTTPYVQQQVILTQRLLYSVPLMASQASMTHPDWTPGQGQGEIMQLGNARNLTTVRNGVDYQVIERRYAVFPQHSGEMEIDRTIFTGVIDDPASRFRDPFGLSGQRVRRSSAPLKLMVQANPQTAANDWLPAKNLTLNAYWQPANGKLKAGEPAHLTLAIMAEGLLAEQLPPLTLNPPTGIKAYSNDPVFRNDFSGNTALGIREEQWVIMGTADGNFTLPEISLQWWNVAENRLETALVPAKTLSVSGAGSIVGALNPSESQRQSEQQAQQLLEDLKKQRAANDLGALIQPEVSDQPSATSANWLASLSKLAWLLAGLLALLLIGVASFYWWWRRSLDKDFPPPVTAANSAHLQLACKQNNALLTHKLLQEWVKHESCLSPPTLNQLRTVADSALLAALEELDAALYSSTHQSQSWQGGERLWTALQLWQAQRKAKAVQAVTNDSGLALMYPD